MRARQISTSLALALGLAAALLAAPAHGADERCAAKNGGRLHCGDCNDADIALLPNKCDRGWTQVIYDLGQPFPPDPLHPRSYATIRARPNSPCAGMVDTVEPLAPNPGEIKVPMTGYAVGCWSPPDKDGCRIVKFLNGATMCLHIAHELLGTGCTGDCADVSTEQVVLSTAGAADHFVCPPADPTLSCRSQRSPRGNGKEKFRLWFGGFCSTNGCDGAGTASPQIGADTCVAPWGATYLGYAVGKSRALGPGWYDWQSGAFKVDYRNGKGTCGPLDRCLGSGSQNPWDLSIVAVPRGATPPPCLVTGDGTCSPQMCFQ